MKRQAARQERAERYDVREAWWTRLVGQPEATLHKHITPGASSWIGASAGVRGLNLNYVVTQEGCGAELYIDRGAGADAENKAIYDQLFVQKDSIEAAYGETLEWQRLDARRACRIRKSLLGGYRSPEDQWDEIQSGLVSAMNRLSAALQPHLKTLRLRP